MSDTKSLAPMLGSMATAIKASLKSQGTAGPVDRAMGAAASLGLCLAILRVVGSAYGASRHLENGESYNAAASSKTSAGSLSHFLLSYVRNFLRRMLLEDDLDVFDDDVDPNPSSTITHGGSCHCGAVAFEVIAPRCLQARDGVGKIQYRHTKVKTASLKVMKGHASLKTYYVVSNGKSHDRGAHAFCQQCGVHILYAPWKNSPHLFINVNCLAEGIKKVRLARGADKMSEAIPAVDEQWDNHSAVSEVSGDSRWNVFQHQDSTIFSASSSSVADTNTWRYDRNEEASVSPSVSDFSYLKKSQFTISPSLTATTESQMSSDASSMMRLDIDETSVRSFKSARTTGSISLKPLNTRLESPADQQLSPAMREQMMRYMKKHLAPSNNGSSNTSKTEPEKIQTIKKQTINVVTPAPVGIENKALQ